MRNKMLAILLVICAIGIGNSNELFHGAKITGVVNTFNANQDGFILGVTKSDGTPTSVVFLKSYFVSLNCPDGHDNFKRAYATALAGMSMGCYVTVFEYTTGQPNYIFITTIP